MLVVDSGDGVGYFESPGGCGTASGIGAQDRTSRGSGMDQCRAFPRIALLFAGLFACAGCAGGAGSARWEPLFDGGSLAGFHTVGNAEWSVLGGEIVGRQGKQQPCGGWLVADRTFRDFELDLEFRTSYWGNSGVVIRDPKGRSGLSYLDGYEIQILNRSDDRFPTGSIYGHASAPYGLHREGAWNRLRIVAIGGNIQVFLNGEKACELPEGARTEAGAIGLQVSSGLSYRDMWVRFRRIRIRDLGGGSPAAAKPPAKTEETTKEIEPPPAKVEAPPAKVDAPSAKSEPPAGEVPPPPPPSGETAPPPPPPPGGIEPSPGA